MYYVLLIIITPRVNAVLVLTLWMAAKRDSGFMAAVVVAFRCVRQAIIETVEFQAFRYQAQTLINHCEAIDRKYTVRIKSRELLDKNFMIERHAADGAIAKIPFQPWDSGTSDMHHFLPFASLSLYITCWIPCLQFVTIVPQSYQTHVTATSLGLG